MSHLTIANSNWVNFQSIRQQGTHSFNDIYTHQKILIIKVCEIKFKDSRPEIISLRNFFKEFDNLVFKIQK